MISIEKNNFGKISMNYERFKGEEPSTLFPAKAMNFNVHFNSKILNKEIIKGFEKYFLNSFYEIEKQDWKEDGIFTFTLKDQLLVHDKLDGLFYADYNIEINLDIKEGKEKKEEKDIKSCLNSLVVQWMMYCDRFCPFIFAIQVRSKIKSNLFSNLDDKLFPFKPEHLLQHLDEDIDKKREEEYMKTHGKPPGSIYLDENFLLHFDLWNNKTIDEVREVFEYIKKAKENGEDNWRDWNSELDALLDDYYEKHALSIVLNQNTIRLYNTMTSELDYDILEFLNY
ncbi:uncharacterized protein KGF55_003800 [Candida pseudojiufengensis]|uniref:uncharacterized protein n=1 Tax=Candida pseudojiufengensis TaxID=497109 RepID=UPI002225A2CE|nr:uncharacterized protein KGF55_003800 [Candida pseudojiufengensis]KAI5961829.1 hypothetical protein KGF55_003800 [Candida pseudojiufengensis]